MFGRKIQMPIPVPKGGPSALTWMLIVAVLCGIGALVLFTRGAMSTSGPGSDISISMPTPPPAAPAAPASTGPAQVGGWGDAITAWARPLLLTALTFLGWLAAGVGVLGLALHHTHFAQRFGWRLLITAVTGFVGDVLLLMAVSHWVGAGITAATTAPLPGGR
jgi:hypothetical protein